LFYVHLVSDADVSHTAGEDSYVFCAYEAVDWHVDDMVKHPLRLGHSLIEWIFKFEFFTWLGDQFDLSRTSETKNTTLERELPELSFVSDDHWKKPS
jgi:hypothetical protein